MDGPLEVGGTISGTVYRRSLCLISETSDVSERRGVTVGEWCGCTGLQSPRGSKMRF